MALRDWISNYGESATATVATPATLESSGEVILATEAVTSLEKDKSDNKGLPPVLDGLHPCILCGGHLFNEGSRGGYFCVDCQTLSEGASIHRVVRGITPRKKDCTIIEPSPPPRQITKDKPSPIALAWLRKHRQALDNAGWTRAEIYQRNRSRGIAWVKIWAKEGLVVNLSPERIIIFQFHDALNKLIKQTARHMELSKKREG